jgi:hypothetical protein
MTSLSNREEARIVGGGVGRVPGAAARVVGSLSRLKRIDKIDVRLQRVKMRRFELSGHELARSEFVGDWITRI